MTLVHSKVRLDDRGHTDSLLCPRCGNFHLHQRSVIVYDREEDADEVLRTSIVDGLASARREANTSQNPSSRRHGVVIAFECENCPDADDKPVIELAIAQHKGETLVEWRHTPAVSKRPAK